ncbi:DUF3558 family protein [Amycolatopsis sp. H20-H5]|uniref:DUF3558 family protein n=1 Tax=Amycolatopsis sp. H20-H5 TaxID=3046309 RepID=UPI002DB72696|nr:DUF3558 family protein [Amycolatopsis sp. H20-H5]MEC3979584.1 DUF3558 family protein [Amycolatopsis sp. H20-H5]
MRTSRAFVLIAALVAATAACSSNEPQAAAPSSSKAPAPAPSSSKAPVAPAKAPCELLPADAVAKAIAVSPVTSAPGPVQENAANKGKSKTCVYSANGKQAGALAVTRYEGLATKPAKMIQDIKAKKPGSQDVGGIGEGAVYYLDEQKTATLVAAKLVGGVPTLVSYDGPAKMTAQMMTPLVKAAIDAS